MTRTMKSLAAAALLMLFVGSVHSAQLVREFRGTDNGVTPAFTVEAPWILDWRLDGDYDQLVALDVSLVEAKTGRHIGQVVHTKRKGNGVRLFKQGGTYQLRVSGSLARWTLKVQQLTPEEAELFTPR
ncbi:MAG: hypothetical protein OEQ30_11245 [Gammaproteobacteria bacterium]|nr:hypothetical protein [Gammaproteobacteria bacterium]MDH3863264.1 hypothetical protein [Gammaproteobacteria bacterium]MDH3904870.1 hypothetical protein [Gammaproteobacteria bacterium]MDH4004185.1 hypothetical protein [Gammaproteobacteria bacterium]